MSSNLRSNHRDNSNKHSFVGEDPRLSRYYPAADMIHMPRLIRRDLPYHQSRNRLNLEMKDLKKMVGGLRQEDWFHVALRQNTYKSLLILLISWTLAILLFAGLYMGVDKAYSGTDCGLASNDRGLLNFGAYFAFSLETTSTVGYGLPGSTNSFFENCPAVQGMIYLQMVWSMMYNAFLFAFFFARLARTDLRGTQVVFSKTAILTKTPVLADGSGGSWMFQVRVCDVDAAYPVVEAHVRLYAKIGPQLIEMRILSPNDVLGANIFLSWPTTIKHEVDVHSPLHPPVEDPFRLPNSGLNLRNAESVAGDVEQYACPCCAEQYGDMNRLRKHVAYYQLLEANDDVLPIKGTHRAIDLATLVPPPSPGVEGIRDWYPDEVIAVVEGIDSLMSGTFQAIQSYTLEDIAWGGEFSDCLRFNSSKTLVDLNKFHEVGYCKYEDEDEDSDFKMGRDSNLRQSNPNSTFRIEVPDPPTLPLQQGDLEMNSSLLNGDVNAIFRGVDNDVNGIELPSLESNQGNRSPYVKKSALKNCYSSGDLVAEEHRGFITHSSLRRRQNSNGNFRTPPPSPRGSLHSSGRNGFSARPSPSNSSSVAEERKSYMTGSSLLRRQNSGTSPASPHGKRKAKSLSHR